MALFGEKDLQVSATVNAPLMEAVLINPASQVMILPGLDHLFRPSETSLPTEYGKIATTNDMVAMEPISDWLDGVAR